MKKALPPGMAEIARSIRRAHTGEPLVDLPSGKDVLVVAPHPDDETLMAGGTMARLASEGVTVHVLVATSGEATRGVAASAGEIGNRRRAETVAACRTLGAATPVFLNLPDGRLEAHTEALADGIVAAAERDGIATILAPWWLDGHPDHRAVATAICEADLLESTVIWAGEIWTPLVPNRIVEITAEVERKREAIRGYALAGEAFDLDAVIGLNRYRSVSGLRGVGYAEAFVALPLEDFCRTVSDDRL
jgi:LmbE family N-acetylglucosaminyl deacetylase